MVLKEKMVGSSQVTEYGSPLVGKMESEWVGWVGPKVLREAEESQSWSSWPACTLLAQNNSFLSSLALHCFVCVDRKLNFAPAESNPFGFWLHKPGMSVLGALGLQAEADINQMETLL